MDSKELISQIMEWLKKPFNGNRIESIGNAREYSNQLVEWMSQDASLKKEFGSLIGQVKSVQKSLESMELMHWVGIENGKIAVGHRPSKKLMLDLELQNTTHILTLLAENEGADLIKKLSAKHEIGWLWFPMESATPPHENRNEEVVQLFNLMKSIIVDKGSIYIHCSAGIHRTGMISFAFLRFLGLDESNAKLKLKELRTETSEGVGEERLAWGNELASDGIL